VRNFVKIGLFVSVAIVLIGVGYGLIQRGACSFYGWSMEREVQYKPLVGCAVKTSNGYVLRSELRSVAN
jgi:hypothetical protein